MRFVHHIVGILRENIRIGSNGFEKDELGDGCFRLNRKSIVRCYKLLVHCLTPCTYLYIQPL
ncbi:hypothetical protein VP496E541_P0157 [Vibrio phage 496E54-1]|nr:hypothetical protein VP495E541_P0156 [Vibrio phage 495E54-1]CAH9014099.1 hypothetical protein VP496E541_P0157 [Vibrio phage 496E54-1]